MNAIILLERDFPFSDLLEHNRISDLAVEQVIDKYQGFQGELIQSYPVTLDEKIMRSHINNLFELKEQFQAYLSLLLRILR